MVKRKAEFDAVEKYSKTPKKIPRKRSFPLSSVMEKIC